MSFMEKIKTYWIVDKRFCPGKIPICFFMNLKENKKVLVKQELEITEL